MVFGRKADTVAAPPGQPTTNGRDTVSLRDVQAQVEMLSDEITYLKQRFKLLQTRLLGETRELRRAIEDYEPVEQEGDFDDEAR